MYIHRYTYQVGQKSSFRFSIGCYPLNELFSQPNISISLYLTAAAAAKSHQLCSTLCDPIDGLPPGSSVPGILQAKALIKPSHYCLRKFQSGAGFCSTEQSAFRSTDPFISTPTPLMLPSSTAMDAPNINGLVLYQHL